MASSSAGDVLPQLSASGIDVVLYKDFPAGASDLSQLLREVQTINPDALIAFSYPPETFLMTGQMREIGFNPKMFYATVGVAFPVFRIKLPGPEAVEGIMGSGAWNPEVATEGSKGYFERHVAKFGQEPDRWASAACYASGQILQQAIEVGWDPRSCGCPESHRQWGIQYDPWGKSLSRTSSTRYIPGRSVNGKTVSFMVIGPEDQKQAEPIYPKPEWPAATP